MNSTTSVHVASISSPIRGLVKRNVAYVNRIQRQLGGWEETEQGPQCITCGHCRLQGAHGRQQTGWTTHVRSCQHQCAVPVVAVWHHYLELRRCDSCVASKLSVYAASDICAVATTRHHRTTKIAECMLAFAPSDHTLHALRAMHGSASIEWCC